MKKKVLLSGGTGFVGKSFKNFCSAEFEIEDINLRQQSPEEFNFQGVHCVVHCAALVHQEIETSEADYFAINYELTKRLADQAKKSGVPHFIFLSTSHVFGNSGSLTDHTIMLNESSPCQPRDGYGKSKLAAEYYLQQIQTETFKVSMIRSPMIYGKGAKGNFAKLANLVKKAPLLPFRFDENRRSIVFIKNLCQFISRTIVTGRSGVLLPQDSHPVSLEELILTMARAMDKKIILFTLPKPILFLIFKIFPKNSMRLFGSLAFDSHQSNKDLNYTPLYSTYDGIRSMLE